MSPQLVRSERGFSLIELLVATALALTVLALVFDAMRPAFGDAGAVPETADLQQRLRVSTDALSRTIAAAGSGAGYGRNPGPLNGTLAAVFPYRIGRRSPDPPGTAKRSVITVLAVPAGAAATTLADPLPARPASVRINLDPACRVGDLSCGFRNGMMVLVFDDTGGFDLFTVTAVAGTLLTLQHAQTDVALVHPAGQSRIVEILSRTFLLKSDRVNEVYQLEQYDGGSGGDVPIADHVVDLAFAYLGDPAPPRLRKPLTEPTGPWTTYGPAPPPAAERPTLFPAGENCVFVRDVLGEPSPRLASLSAATGPVRLTPDQLSDGPWCPDEASPNRYDADLLRVRAIDVTVRVESASAALRGPAGILFARGGTSTDARRLVPDQVLRFQIAPRNLNTSP